MGFGILLLGYMINAFFSVLGNYTFIGMLIGYFLMFCALCELRKYAPTFLYALICSITMLFLSFAETFIGIDILFSLGITSNMLWLTKALTVAEFAIGLLFNLSLLYGIADLARRVEFDTIRTKAFRNMIFMGVYAAYRIFLFIPKPALYGEEMFLWSLLLLLIIIYSVANLILIFKCYAFICPQGDEDMPRKPSRFEFVNRWRERNDAKEQETIDYYNKKIQEKQNAKNKKRKKK